MKTKQQEKKEILLVGDDAITLMNLILKQREYIRNQNLCKEETQQLLHETIVNFLKGILRKESYFNLQFVGKDKLIISDIIP